MFCARCGQQQADGAAICPFCGQPANMQWQPTPAPSPMAGTAPAPQFSIAPPVIQPLQGVGGWLLFFCISFTILWPLWVLSQYALYHFVLSLFSVVALLRLTFGVVVGVALWMGKPVAIVLLRIYFVLTGVMLLWSLFNVAPLFLRYHGFPLALFSRLLVVLGSPLVFLLFGVLYFSQSERVRATYGSKLF